MSPRSSSTTNSRAGRAARPTSPARRPATPNPRSRRKRAAARRIRRFEGIVARLPVQPESIGAWFRQIQAPVAVQPTPWRWSKILSALILAAAFYAIVAVHTQDEWFVYAEDVDFGRLTYVAPAQLYALSEVEGWNTLWLQAKVVEQRLGRHPWVAGAKVQIHAPGRLTARIQERTPVAVWVTNRGAYWLAASGAALAMSPTQAEKIDEVMLPQIVDSLGEAQQLGVDHVALNPAILDSALSLIAAIPELQGKVRYNQVVGLNFSLSNPNVWVYWGDGYDMETKLENLAALRSVVNREESGDRILDVSYVNHPYIR